MNRSKLLLVLFITIFQIGITVYAQKVSNITYRQEQSNIIVSYDLDTKTPCKVSLYVSTNAGTSWQGPLIKVTGDVGDKIILGSNSITWNVLEEFDELRGDKIMFQVRAVGNNIETVIIGAQEWTTKNLDVSKYRNGDIIPEVKDNNEWYDLSTGAWCYYNNDPKNGAIYGKLYNWYAVNDPRGLAPEGFHVPSIAEWDILTAYLGDRTSAGGKMKEAGTLHWPFPNTYATNRIGFTGIPGRSRYGGGKFDDDAGGISSYWWSSSTYDSRDWGYKHNLAYELDLWSRDNYARQNAVGKGSGLSVRCIRD